MLQIFILPLLVFQSMALVTDSSTPANTASCYECIKAGYVFCTNKDWYSVLMDNLQGYTAATTGC